MNELTPGLRAYIVAQKLPTPPSWNDVYEERRETCRRLAAGFRLLARFGMDLGGAGHVTARDPVDPGTFWVNPIAKPFSRLKASDMLRVTEDGKIVAGQGALNLGAFNIHSRIHAVRQDVKAAVHVHSIHACAFGALGRPLAYLTQDSTAFFNDLATYNFGGAAVELAEGDRIAQALGNKKAAILTNHGLLTTGRSVDSAIWWAILLERCCQIQLLAEAAAAPTNQPLQIIPEEICRQSYEWVGVEYAGWLDFQPLYEEIVAQQPDLLD